MTFGQRLSIILKVIIRKQVTWYIFGIATIPFILFILFISGVNPPPSETDLLISKWHIAEQQDGRFLTMHIPSYENVFFFVGIERNPENGLLEEIGVINARGQSVSLGGIERNHPRYSIDQHGVTYDPNVPNIFPCFVFRTKGRYDFPMAVYGLADHGIVWRDYNADSIFDQKIDYQNRTMMIDVEGRWVKGTGKEKVVTDEGVFNFNASSGKWEIVDANSSLN